MIPESFIQELLARVAVEDIVGRYVQLKKGGANLLGLCPFHDEKTPSFTVSPTKQFYHCFGCGAHGSAINFLMAHTGATFPEAVRSLAGEIGLTVPETRRSPAQRQADRRRQVERSQHEQVLELAFAAYTRQLRDSPQAIQYLQGRGLTGQTAKTFGLGWSGSGSRPLASVLTDYDSPILVEAGLVIDAEDGRRYDRFRDRIMFPIRNRRGQLIGFGGRLIAEGAPKYLNSPETVLFSKGHELYGLWENSQGIRQHGHVLVTEGYMDVVALAEHGLNNAVATLGTATTETHLQMLMRTSERIVFCFDGDDAGARAAWRAMQTCLPLMRDDTSVRFLFLPDQHDPDSFIQQYGVDAFKKVVEQASALSRFFLDGLAQRHVMEEPEGRAACVHEALPMLSLLPDATFRRQLEDEFAHQVRLTPDELTRALARHIQSEGVKGTVAVPAGNYPPSSLPQSHSPSSELQGFDDQHAVTLHSGWASAPRQRAVTPMAKRLLRLLLAHPELIESMSNQQLEILSNSPHLVLVRDLITLANVSAARHAGALLQAVDPDSDLAAVLQPLATELLTEEDLPDPLAEWNDALGRIERQAIKAEQSALIRAGLHDITSQKRYQQLTRQLALLDIQTRDII